MSLKDYKRKRNFKATPEPEGSEGENDGTESLRFVVQKHIATRPHYDFRLECDGVLKSWAVPKGPSQNPLDQRLAVHVEDHPVSYGSFEGAIPKGNYGAGSVMIWDAGTFTERKTGTADKAAHEAAVRAGLEKGRLTIVMSGTKLRGEFALIKLKKGAGKEWLLLKKRDRFADYKVDITKQDRSVLTGRTMEEIAAQAVSKEQIWLPGKGPLSVKSLQDMSAAQPEKVDVENTKPESVTPPPAADFRKSLKLTAAPKERPPKRLKPMLAKQFDGLFRQRGWFFEPLYGGFRTLAYVEDKKVSLLSKQLLSFDRVFPEIAAALKELKGSYIFDGEICVEDSAGKSSLALLQAYKQDRVGKPVFHINDLLHQAGRNLRVLPLRLRKQELKKLKIFNDVLRYCEHTKDDGGALEKLATESGFDSILARDSSSPYVAGTSKSWLKIKTAAGGPVSKSEPHFTHLKKVYFRKLGITKGDLIEYYRSVAAYILPYLKDRPQSLHRHPNGIEGESFFHKDMTSYLPAFVKTHRIYSSSSQKSINYLLCQNEETLLYMANLGCIEINSWLSRIQNLESPDFVVIDLDPGEQSFKEVVTVAREVHEILEAISAPAFAKTSGSSGIHLCIPLGAKYSYDEGRAFSEAVCRIVEVRLPKLTTMERNPNKRRGKLYLDCLQNRRSQTLASVYSVRPNENATVSAPIAWSELTPKLSPLSFTIHNMRARLDKVGDLWAPMLNEAADLPALFARLEKLK